MGTHAHQLSGTTRPAGHHNPSKEQKEKRMKNITLYCALAVLAAACASTKPEAPVGTASSGTTPPSTGSTAQSTTTPNTSANVAGNPLHDPNSAASTSTSTPTR
jgi:hypothetical protein